MSDRQNTVRHGGVLADSALITGSPRYMPRGQWRPLHAVIVTLVIAFAALGAGAVVTYIILPTLVGISPSDFAEQHEHIAGLVALAFVVAAILGLTWIAAGLLGDRPSEVLQLDAPLPQAIDVLAAIAGYTLLCSAFVTVRYALDPAALIAEYNKDNEYYLTALREAYWPVVIPLLLGIAFAGEILFQGFLLSGFAKLRWGFWGMAVTMGAILSGVSSTVLAGAAQEFVITVYACWLTWRSGRIWLAIFCELWGSAVLFAIMAIGTWT